MSEPGFSPVEIAEIKRRSKQSHRFFTSEQVRTHLQALQMEWDRMGGFDKSYMHSYLNALNDREPAHYRTRDGKWVTFMLDIEDKDVVPARRINTDRMPEP